MENKLAEQIIGCAIEFHRKLGAGLLESAYRECLKYMLSNQDSFAESEKPQPLVCHDLKFSQGYRIDLLVEREVVVELGCVEALNDVHLAQILTNMQLRNYPLGLLSNFNVKLLKEGLIKVILKKMMGCKVTQSYSGNHGDSQRKPSSNHCYISVQLGGTSTFLKQNSE